MTVPQVCVFVNLLPRDYRATLTLEEKKEVHLVQPLAPALTLTLALTQTLNHLANKPQQTSTLFDLMYSTNSSTTDYKYLTSARRITYIWGEPERAPH